MKLLGKRAIVTGASLGLGRQIAEAFINEGASVLLCARNAVPLENAVQQLKKISPDQKVLWRTCDVHNPEQVESLVQYAIDQWGGCDILVNNAAIQGPIGPIEKNSWDEWRQAMEINFYGTVLPCRSVIPQMKKQGGGKIINLSGGGATGPRPFFTAYAAAKSAVVHLTETLAEELRSHSIDINAIAPGPLKTRLMDDILQAGAESAGEKAYAEALKVSEGKDDPDSFAPAAKLAVFLASSESDGITGKLISALWDNWRNLAKHRATLAVGDIYSLRRILPGDRGENWDK